MLKQEESGINLRRASCLSSAYSIVDSNLFNQVAKEEIFKGSMNALSDIFQGLFYKFLMDETEDEEAGVIGCFAFR